ncbi:hypothetical protein [Brevundimonas sp.]|jgi:hypothetical protein|uniref:hypothetical protein n=1 Tax=Brevundimonas sp. TaxID=1871086 RepID=UPI002FD90350
MRLTPEELAARKRRNIALAWALVAFMALVFTTTFLRMQHNRAEAAATRQAVLAAQAPAQAPAARP